MRYIVYILLSVNYPLRYYIGVTQNLKNRLKKHNTKAFVGYSNRYAPWRVETYTVFNNKLLAENFEQYLKSGSGNVFLKRRLI